MNLPDKKTLNLLQYGTTKPTLWQRFGLQKSIPLYEVLKNELTGLKDYWTRGFEFSGATKQEIVREGYNKNVVVYSIITRISRVAAQAPWAIYTVKDKGAFERYKSLQKQDYSPYQQFELKRARKKALEVNERHFLNHVFQSPNEQQSGAEYMENLLGFKLLTGDCYEYGNMLRNGMPGELWALPPQFMKIIASNTFPVRETGYQLSFGANIIPLTTKEVMHSKYWNPNWDSAGGHLYGFAPLDAAWLSNLQDNNARESLVDQLQKRGRRGIFTVDSPAITEVAQFQEVKGYLKEDWANSSKEYKDDIMPVFGKGSWHHVGLSVKDMAAIEVCGMTLKDLCNAYGVSDLLFNNQQASTRDNLKIARKDFITNAVLPLLTSVRDGRNRKLQKDWNPKGENIIVDFDPTVYTELETDKKDTVDWMKDAGCFTDNEIREQLDFERAEYVYADEPWKKSADLPVSLIDKQLLSRKITGNEKV